MRFSARDKEIRFCVYILFWLAAMVLLVVAPYISVIIMAYILVRIILYFEYKVNRIVTSTKIYDMDGREISFTVVNARELHHKKEKHNFLSCLYSGYKRIYYLYVNTGVLDEKTIRAQYAFADNKLFPGKEMTENEVVAICNNPQQAENIINQILNENMSCALAILNKLEEREIIQTYYKNDTMAACKINDGNSVLFFYSADRNTMHGLVFNRVIPKEQLDGINLTVFRKSTQFLKNEVDGLGHASFGFDQNNLFVCSQPELNLMLRLKGNGDNADMAYCLSLEQVKNDLRKINKSDNAILWYLLLISIGVITLCLLVIALPVGIIFTAVFFLLVFLTIKRKRRVRELVRAVDAGKVIVKSVSVKEKKYIPDGETSDLYYLHFSDGSQLSITEKQYAISSVGDDYYHILADGIKGKGVHYQKMMYTLSEELQRCVVE